MSECGYCRYNWSKGRGDGNGSLNVSNIGHPGGKAGGGGSSEDIFGYDVEPTEESRRQLEML